jgi:hypothetical protein
MYIGPENGCKICMGGTLRIITLEWMEQIDCIFNVRHVNTVKVEK